MWVLHPTGKGALLGHGLDAQALVACTPVGKLG